MNTPDADLLQTLRRLAGRPTKHIGVDAVVGDELFDAVVFLGDALNIPALVPGDDVDLDASDEEDDLHDAVTAEFVAVPFKRH